jgi:hypothetical protein
MRTDLGNVVQYAESRIDNNRNGRMARIGEPLTERPKKTSSSSFGRMAVENLFAVFSFHFFGDV